ncbi:Uncharacterised protein [[Pasteurella] mairii]|uniref:Uncharacterized protein n=1 Tax=[Pasteurella] mairii TaxID=757 RepID=A0A379B6P2_9PAST|nr:Uncharacterised protein [[Pasteurella] mairii]
MASKAINIAPKLVATAEKYPLLTEMGVTAITNTAYQLTNKDTFDPYDFLKAEMSTVLSKDKKAWQQAYINVGLNVLGTTDPADYGWNALAGVTGTFAAYKAGKIQINSPLNKIISPIGSSYIGEYSGDSELLKEKIKQWEAKYND